MREQYVAGLKAQVDEIMTRLGYEKWTDEDVKAELKKRKDEL